MVDMCFRLRCYLYAFLLILVSTVAHSATEKEIAMGGFAYTVYCSHPSDLDFCVNASYTDAKKQACMLWMTQLNSAYGYSFVNVTAGGTGICNYQGKNPADGSAVYDSAQLSSKAGLCPAKGNAPPTQVIFSRTGRWFPQELESTRCFRSCNYSNGQNFTYKHYAFTNGVTTTFTENTSARLASKAEFCDPVAEPSKNSEGEVTYDANCDDSFLTVFCNFVEWYRSDSEMPEAPTVETEQINLAYIKTDHVHVDAAEGATCFEPIIYDIQIPWSGDRVEQEINFSAMCERIDSYGNIWRALYLLAACYVIFGGRK